MYVCEREMSNYITYSHSIAHTHLPCTYIHTFLPARRHSFFFFKDAIAHAIECEYVMLFDILQISSASMVLSTFFLTHGT